MPEALDKHPNDRTHRICKSTKVRHCTDNSLKSKIAICSPTQYGYPIGKSQTIPNGFQTIPNRFQTIPNAACPRQCMRIQKFFQRVSSQAGMIGAGFNAAVSGCRLWAGPGAAGNAGVATKPSDNVCRQRCQGIMAAPVRLPGGKEGYAVGTPSAWFRSLQSAGARRLLYWPVAKPAPPGR